MNTNRFIVFGLIVVLVATVLSCGSKERRRVEGIKENISLEYHADLELIRTEEEGFILDITEVFDIAKRPSEGNKIIGVRIGDKNITHKVIGAGEYEYIEEPDTIRINLGETEEFLSNQAGRFRLRLTRSDPITGSPSGIFRRKLTFEPAQLWALVEDERSPEGFTPVELDEPDLGYIILHTTTALGNKQPSGGRRATDKRSLTYAIPADIATLKPLTFTYFPSRGGYYVGSAVMWIVNRVAWMLLGIVLYVWWVRSRDKRRKARAELKMAKKKEGGPPEKPPPLPQKSEPDKGETN
jgi:hypothetical protein